MAGSGLSTLELPLWHQIGVGLVDVERPGGDVRGIAHNVLKDCRVPASRHGGDKVGSSSVKESVAIEAFLFVVVIVLHDNRVRTVVLEYGLGVVPTEIVGSHDRASRAVEFEGVAARHVVATPGAEVDVPIGQHDRRGSPSVIDATRSRPIGRRVDTVGGAEAALPFPGLQRKPRANPGVMRAGWTRGEGDGGGRHQIAAAVVEGVRERGRPLEGQIGIYRYHVRRAVAAAKPRVMAAACRVNGPIWANSWRDVECRTLGAAETRTGRCGWSGRPRKRQNTKIALARSGRVDRRQQRGIADHAHAIIGGDLDQPTVDQRREDADGLVLEPDRVVVDVSVAVGTEWSGHEGEGVERAKRADPTHDAAIPSVQLEHAATEARVIDEVVYQHGVVDRL